MRQRSVTETPLDLKGVEWLGKPAPVRARLLNAAFRYWRDCGFPYYRLDSIDIRQEFGNLVRHDWKGVFLNTGVLGSNLGLRLANFFQPGMWSVRVSRYRSPMDVFLDDGLLKEALRRSLSIWPDRFGANASCLRRMLKTFPGTASVSNFRPTLARAIVGRYGPARATMVDFAAGYGGRLIGALSLGAQYVGIEPCPEQCRGLNEAIRSLRRLGLSATRSEIVTGCAEDAMPGLRTGSADLVFSSPPYYDWERYSDQPTQSFVRYSYYPEWLAGFLRPVIRESRRVLKPGGYLVLNVSNGRRRPAPDEVSAMARELGFTRTRTHRMLIPKVPYLHPRDAKPNKCELLMVFRRGS